MRISDWSSDVCSSDLGVFPVRAQQAPNGRTFVFPLDPSSCLLVEQVYGSRIKPERHKIAAGYLLASVEREAYLRALRFRSEERRVGKECVSTGRSRGSPDHKKQQKFYRPRYIM